MTMIDDALDGDDGSNDAYDGGDDAYDGDDDDGNEDDDNDIGFNTGEDSDGHCADDAQQISEISGL